MAPKQNIPNKFILYISLGSHQLVLLNSGHDLGIIDDLGDALSAYKGLFSSEEEKEFLRGRPRSDGLSLGDIGLVKNSLKKADENDGLIIVGMHAGPIGTYSLPHYLRETEHPNASIEDIAVYLAKCPGSGFIFNFYKKGKIYQRALLNILQVPHSYPLRRFKTWKLVGTDYFMRGRLHKYLKKGIGVHYAEKFLKICVGLQGEKDEKIKKPIDLVLFGHGHNHIEYRLKWDWNRKNRDKKDLLFYMDFYTENPSEYYLHGSMASGNLSIYFLEKVRHREEVHLQLQTPGETQSGRSGGGLRSHVIRIHLIPLRISVNGGLNIGLYSWKQHPLDRLKIISVLKKTITNPALTFRVFVLF